MCRERWKSNSAIAFCLAGGIREHSRPPIHAFFDDASVFEASGESVGPAVFEGVALKCSSFKTPSETVAKCEDGFHSIDDPLIEKGEFLPSATERVINLLKQKTCISDV